MSVILCLKAMKQIEVIGLCFSVCIHSVSSFHLDLHSDLWYLRKGHWKRMENPDKICGYAIGLILITEQ